MKHPLLRPLLIVLALAGLPGFAAAKSFDTEVKKFIDQMVAEHDFDREYLDELFAKVETRDRVLELISRPAEKAKPWHEYRDIFLQPERITAGVQFWKENEQLIGDVATHWGVAPEIVVAILGVETYYGRLTGGFPVLDTLATLAFEYPPRSKFFRSELEQFLLLTREENVDPSGAIGSYAGAMGAPQFISSSYRRYAVDTNEDGRRDLWSDWNDIVGSVANYFSEHGWKEGEPVVARVNIISRSGALLAEKNSLKLAHSVESLREHGVEFSKLPPCNEKLAIFSLDARDGKEYWVGFKNFYVITRYNHSPLYAMAVYDLSREIRQRIQ